jgi:phosphoglycerate dehydrogenase-like enzyme
MGKKLILSTFKLDETSKARLIGSLSDDWEYRNEEEIGEDGFESVEILLLGGFWLTKERIRSMKNLRMIQSYSAGVEHIDFEAIPLDVAVCSNAGAFAGPIAEFVFGTVISLGRNLEMHDREMRNGKFIRTPLGLYLLGKTFGIIGTGGIGHETAKLAKSFGMKTMGINTTGSAVRDFDTVVNLDGLNTLLSESDVILVAAPLTVKTRDLLGCDQFRLMKPNCIIVNVARGAIINEQALYEFLRDHPDAKAALDVWWRYPKTGEGTVTQDYPISSLPNVLSSPHFSDGVGEQLKMGSDSAVDNIIRYLKNEPLKGIVRREDYFGLNTMKSHP